jgi:hypothetical protein
VNNGLSGTGAGLNQDLVNPLNLEGLLNQGSRPNTAGEQPNNLLDTGIRMALAKNFAKKVANSKKINEETKESVTLLRNQFMMYLAKVYDNATKKEGVLGCHRII